jgi:DNA ligase-1
MRRFTRLYMEIDATTATSRKAALMEAYLREAPPADAAVALYYLTGQRPKRLLPTRVMRDAVLEATGVPDWLLDECYAAVGDFSETAALLLPDRAGPSDRPVPQPSGPDIADGAAGDASSPSLAEVFERYVLPLGGLDAPAQKALLFEAWGLFDAEARLVFNKIIRGGFRVGVQRAMVIQALAAATGMAREEASHRLTGGVTPTADWFRALVSPDGPDGTAAAGRAYPFFLASPLGEPPESLGEVAGWQVEPKYDGIRAQLIRRDGQTWLWSRGEEPIGPQFPELVAASRALPDGTVLDGEVLVWRGDRPLPFSVLQTRLNRKGAPAERGLQR